MLYVGPVGPTALHAHDAFQVMRTLTGRLQLLGPRRREPRMISDNGPQFIAKDFKEFIRLTGMTHVRTSPYYPQSIGKIERRHKTIKQDAIRPSQAHHPR